MKKIFSKIDSGRSLSKRSIRKGGMMNLLRRELLLLPVLSLILFGCGDGESKFDATGTFESEEVIVSSEAMGKLVRFDVEEGNLLKKDQLVGIVDTLQLHLKKKQLKASINAVLSKQPDIAIQLAAIEEQIKTASTEKRRVENLVRSNAATTKQLDDVTAQLDILNRQFDAAKSNLSITKQGLMSETYPLLAQIEQIEDQISKSKIVNPVNGTVLTRYAKQNEVTSSGKALYKIADLSKMTLRAYVNGDQLGQIKLGQSVRVFVDKGEGEQKAMSGEIYWISSKAEFTPKTIQTKDERANLVYAVKIYVNNDGYLKIGMYGEVRF